MEHLWPLGQAIDWSGINAIAALISALAALVSASTALIVALKTGRRRKRFPKSLRSKLGRKKRARPSRRKHRLGGITGRHR